MRAQLLAALRALLVFTVLLRPRLPAGRHRRVAQLAFDDKADGSLVRRRRRGGRVGAARPDLHRCRVLPRPPVGGRRRGRRLGVEVSTTTASPPARRRSPTRPTSPSRSGASNLGPTNPDLLATVAERVEAYRDEQRPRRRRPGAGRRRHRLGLGPRPAHLGGQRPAPGRRVAEARGLASTTVLALVDEHTEGPSLGVPRRGGRQRARAEPGPRPRQAERRGRRRQHLAPCRRGTLRIYLGAAPGVGKTFAMLNEGRRRRERGTDVVVGLRRDPRPGPHRRAARRPRGRAPPDGRLPRARPSRRWTSTPSWPAGPRWRWSTSWPTPTCPGQPQRQALAGRRRAARRRHRRHLDGQHPAPRVAQRRRRAHHRRRASARPCPTRWCGPPTRSSWST